MATEHDEDLDLQEPAGDVIPPEADPPHVDEVDEHDEHDEAEEGTAKVDAELEQAADPAEREEIIKRRREARRNKNQRQKERMERLANENRQLNERLSKLEQGFSGLQNNDFGRQLAKVDEEIGKATQAHQWFLRVEAEAITKQNGQAAAQARENAVMARERAQQLTAIKNNAVAASQQQTPARQPADPIVVRHAQEFMAEHPWYKGVNATDTDSMVLNAIDRSVQADGYDPRSPDYWKELRERTKIRLANVIGKNYTDRDRSQAQRSDRGRTSPVAGASSASPPSGQASRLSPDQVQAIKDAGMWNDPAQRAKAIKAYQNYAKTH